MDRFARFVAPRLGKDFRTVEPLANGEQVVSNQFFRTRNLNQAMFVQHCCVVFFF